MDQSSSPMRKLVIVVGLSLLLAIGMLLYTQFLSDAPLGSVDSLTTGEQSEADDIAARVIKRQGETLRELYTTVVQVHDYTFVPDSVVVRPGEEIAFFTPDPRVYDIAMNDKRLFVVQGTANGASMAVSTFLFSYEGSYIFDIDGSSKEGALVIKVQP